MRKNLALWQHWNWEVTTSYSDLKDIEVTCINKSEMKCNVQGEIETKAKFPRLGQILFITFFVQEVVTQLSFQSHLPGPRFSLHFHLWVKGWEQWSVMHISTAIKHFINNWVLLVLSDLNFFHLSMASQGLGICGVLYGFLCASSLLYSMLIQGIILC